MSAQKDKAVTVSLNKLHEFCKTLVSGFAEKQLVVLDGSLGVGKTEFVKTCVQELGGETPDSPTFPIINEYKAGEKKIFHVDLFRLKTMAEIESTGFWDLFDEKNCVVFVEWGSRIDPMLWPVHWYRMQIDIRFATKEKSRRISYRSF